MKKKGLELTKSYSVLGISWDWKATTQCTKQTQLFRTFESDKHFQNVKQAYIDW